MRYTTMVQDMIGRARYGDGPASTRVGMRYSDEQLYALAVYIYSLRPPENPNKFAGLAVKGKAVFEKERCGRCHTAPLYTNNKLIPVEGFAAVAGGEVSSLKVGTDPRYALQSRKGTGYYKVPSLKGLWYRGPLEHQGSVATLEEWFDPKRVSAEHVPGGYKGPDGKARGVKGHAFGLKLSEGDRAALIAFLRTL